MLGLSAVVVSLAISLPPASLLNDEPEHSTKAPADIRDLVDHGFADSNGMKIHYATMGDGPLLVLLHGFPDFWYSWRAQMPALAEHFRVVAIDLRGQGKRIFQVWPSFAGRS